MSALASRRTPFAVLDLDRLDANIQRMQARVDRLGVGLRPHVKTPKCREVVARQLAAGARGVTVSTLAEARWCFDMGVDDVIYAVGIVPQKLREVLELRRRGCNLRVVLDSIEAAQAVAGAGKEARHRFEVLIEIDVDGHRAGVSPTSPRLVTIAETLQQGGAELAGVLTHGGGSYGVPGLEALAAFAEQERSLCLEAADRLRAAGFPCHIVSVGSTPTAAAARRWDGITEIRAGVYVLQDLVMAGLGVCLLDDIALSVATTVIGHQVEKGWVLVDAGWTALSRDRGTAVQAVDQGYGVVCTEDGEILEDWIVAAVNQEHGIVTRRDRCVVHDLAEVFPYGSRLRILPNHACATADQFDSYLAWRSGAIVEEWRRERGW
jgi:D-serine deaminase-like pyridoxal phosphate-dependent protein